MTKRIKSLKHLREEKKRLEQRKVELEKAIHYDWRDVKESIKPRHFAGQILSGIFNENRNVENTNQNTMADGLSAIAAILTKIAVEKIEVQFNEWLNKK
ncbi:MAG: hypothetical protein QM725_09430 [Lacibacter sp.]